MTLTIATVNVNGLRAAVRKGMPDWLADTPADVITLQEVRAPGDLLAGLVGDEWSIMGERSEEHTSELQSRGHLVCRLLLEKKKRQNIALIPKLDIVTRTELGLHPTQLMSLPIASTNHY